jgi:hypothetical protein
MRQLHSLLELVDEPPIDKNPTFITLSCDELLAALNSRNPLASAVSFNANVQRVKNIVV